MKRSLVFAFLLLAFYACKKDETPSSNENQTVAQIVVTSDIHYGTARIFRGAMVNADVVNKEFVKQINRVPASSFPSDGGLNAGKQVGAIDELIITGDITSKQKVGPPLIQSATLSWGQFNEGFMKGITLKNGASQNAGLWFTPGNHDVTNAIGGWYPMNPLTDPDAMVNIYNIMLAPANPLSNSTYNYTTDKINYSKDIAGVHCMFVNMWPDSVARIWMENDLSKVSSTTPVILFTHDEPDIEAAHLTNPNGNHTINAIDKFENVVAEVCKDGATYQVSSTIEQRNFVTFLQAHKNVKAYFHGNSNYNQFYTYKGPDSAISLNVFRIDSPMKGMISGTEAPDGIGDETKLSFQVIVIDGASKKLTVRECLWNTAGAASPLVWGTSLTISLN
ncbi:MAG: metallophosphoesterase [Bacteroidetes bacterium]|nr:metallophosphoesterase [Bacteroidota bacterium]